jgi:heptaprenyl diphosphate synthase
MVKKTLVFILSALLFGNVVSLIYSISGAVLALLAMIVMKRLDRFSSIGVSVVGGLAHNVGQILAACMVMKTSAIVYYLIPLTISGTIAGVVIGLLSAIPIIGIVFGIIIGGSVVFLATGKKKNNK